MSNPLDHFNVKMAIVGIGLRLPGDVRSLDDYKNFLREEKNAIQAQPGVGPAAEYRASVNLEAFDNAFFNISDREAATLDPQQQLLLETSWEAIEDANIPPSSLHGRRVGVFFGLSGVDHILELSRQGIADPYLATGNSHAAAAGRVAYYYGFKGPAIAVDTACSSSLTALHLAVQSLQSRESDAVLIGAVNLARAPEFNTAFSMAKMLSPGGVCNALSSKADGYIRGEGCVVLLAKRYDDALSDQDHVYGLVLGSALNQDGASAGLTVPSGLAQEEVILRALGDAGVSPAAVTYVEAHGTGTALGDPIELAALGRVYGTASSRAEELLVGSVKNNIGHLEAAAGLASLLKVLLIFRDREIPPTINCDEPTHKIDWKKARLKAVNRRVEISPQKDVIICGVSAFSFTGTNGHVILSGENVCSPVALIPTSVRKVKPGVLPISAKSKTSLRLLAEKYSQLARKLCGEDIEKLTATAWACRDHHYFRLALPYSDERELCEALDRSAVFGATENNAEDDFAAGTHVVFVFTGQGSQYAGMGAGLYIEYPVFSEMIDRCRKVLADVWAVDLLDVLWGAHQHLLHQTRYCQASLVALEMAIAALYESAGITPSAVVGHSLGEISAVVFAGILSVEEGLRLAAYRGELMETTEAGAMIAVNVPADDLEAITAHILARGDISVAAYNSSTSTVYSGSTEAIDTLEHWLEEQSISCHRLGSRKGFHSALMQPVCEKLTTYAAQLRYRKAKIALATNVSGLWADDTTFCAAYWARHAVEPVRFRDAIGHCIEKNYHTFLEIGPGNSLVALIRGDYAEQVNVAGTLNKHVAASRSILAPVALLYEKGAGINWQAFSAALPSRSFALPSYSFERRTDKRGALPEPETGLSAEAGYRKYMIATGDVVFDSSLSLSRHGYLADHMVAGRIVVPAAYYLRAFVDTARDLISVPAKILDCRFIRPLILQSDETWNVQLHYRLLSQGRWKVIWYARTADLGSQTDWTAYAEAEVSNSTGVVLPHWNTDCNVVITQETLCHTLNAAGLSYGECFRPLQSIACDESGAAVGIFAPTKHHGSEDVCRLDGAFQLVAAVLLHQGRLDQLLVPSTLEEIQLDQTAQFWTEARVRIRPSEGAEGEVLADITLAGPNGEQAGLIRGICFRAGVQRQMEATDNHLLMQFIPEWRECASEMIQMCSDQLAGIPVAIIPAARSLLDGAQALAARLKSQWSTLHIRIATGPEDIRPQPGIHVGTAQHLIYLMSSDQAKEDGPEPSAVSMFLDFLKAVQISGQRTHMSVIGYGAAGLAASGYRQSLFAGMLLGAVTECPHLSAQWIDIDDSAGSGALPLQILAELLCNHKTGGFTEMRCSSSTVYRKIWRRHIPARDPGEARMAIRQIGSLDSLALIPRQHLPLAADKVRIEICAVGLNFRDVLHALGAIEEGQTAQGASDTKTLLFGAECSGIVREVGAAVSGFKAGDTVYAGPAIGAMATSVDVSQAFVRVMPEGMSFVQAATIPIAFLTAYIALVIKANLKPGESVLIHGAAGGVGLAAIQIARHIGASIVVTASEKKQGYLRSLGIRHIYDSRTLQFSEAIRSDIGQVDVVLNSLNGEYIPHSLALTKDGGRFVDIGKIGQWSETRVAADFPKLHYHCFDLLNMAENEPSVLSDCMSAVQTLLHLGALAPLPKTDYAAEQSVAAFNAMRSSEHIGKIVLNFTPAPSRSRNIASDNKGCYVVTGGTGGVGLQLLVHLRRIGATHIIVLGRRLSAEVHNVLGDVSKDSPVQLRYLQCDIADNDELEKVLRNGMQDFPPCSCVIHAAGSLEDRTLQSTGWDEVNQVLRPKIVGLENLFRYFGTSVRYLLFSSIASMAGSVGQVGYVAANRYLDSFAQYWNRQGVDVTSVNWGPWSGAGMATRSLQLGKTAFSSQGIGLIAEQDVSDCLQLAYSSGEAQIAMVKISWPLLCASDLARQRPLLDIVGGGAVVGGQLADAAPLEVKQSTTQQIEDEVIHVVRRVLRHRGTISIRPSTRLRELGMDSLMVVELASTLNNRLKVKIPVSGLLASSSIREVTQLVVDIAGGLSDGAKRGTSSVPSGWIVTYGARHGKRGLVCFHHMGGQASTYADWSHLFNDASIDVYSVQLPGREARLGEPYAEDFPTSVPQIARELASLALNDIFLYGHSMGALFAFEVAHALLTDHGIVVQQIFVGGLWGPSQHRTELQQRSFSVQAAVRDMQIPQALLGEKKFMQTLLPMFEADARLFASYTYRVREPLASPITVMLGDRDPVASAKDAEGWRSQTTGRFAIEILSGTHMFHRECAADLVRRIRQRIGYDRPQLSAQSSGAT